MACCWGGSNELPSPGLRHENQRLQGQFLTLIGLVFDPRIIRSRQSAPLTVLTEAQVDCFHKKSAGLDAAAIWHAACRFVRRPQ